MKRIFIIISCLILALLVATLVFAVYNEYRPKQIFAYSVSDELSGLTINFGEQDYHRLKDEELEKTLAYLKNTAVYEKSKPEGEALAEFKMVGKFSEEKLTLILYEEHLLYGETYFRCDGKLAAYFKGIIEEYRDYSPKMPFADLRAEDVVRITMPNWNGSVELPADRIESVVERLNDVVICNRNESTLYGSNGAYFNIELANGETIELYTLSYRIYIGYNGGQKKGYECSRLVPLERHYWAYWEDGC